MTQAPIPYGRQHVGPEEARRVREVMESPWLTQGPKVPEFEDKLQQVCGANHAIAVSHGTTALYLACRAAGLGPGDRFLTSPITFVATANAGLLCGAEPVFVDIDPVTLNLDPALVAQAVAADPTIKVVLPVHMGGRVCALDVIAEACAGRGVRIIEDACHAIGGRWCDRAGQWHVVGDGAFSDMTCFSFHPVKTVTTGEGGAVLTNDEELAHRLQLLRNHGIDRAPAGADVDPWVYAMEELSLNGRLTDIQAAIGVVQMAKLPRLQRRRLELVARYDENLSPLAEVVPQGRPAGEDGTSWHLMIVRVQRRRELYKYLHGCGIGTQVHYIPVHLQPYYRRRFGTGPGDFPVAEKYYDEALTLPLFPDLSEADQDRVVAALREFYTGPTPPAGGVAR